MAVTTPRIQDCFIHIGTEKTGTTSVQTTLRASEHLLNQHGCVFPLTLGKTSQWRLALYCSESQINTPVVMRSGGIEAFRETTRNSLYQECRVSEASKLILSCELLHRHVVSDKERRRLFELVEPISVNRKIIVYIRRQDRLAVSLHSTALRGGATQPFPALNDIPNGNRRLYFNYAQLLKGYGDVFGQENLIVRIYSKNDLVGSDVVKDFAHVVGLGDLAKPLPGASVNTSLNRLGQSFLALLNKEGKSISAPRRKKIIAALEQRYSGHGHLPTREEARTFYNSFTETNEWVRKTFFASRPTLFDEEFDEYPDQPAPTATAEDMVRVAAEILAEI